MTVTSKVTETQISSELKPLMTLAQFQEGTVEVFLHYVRNLMWMTDAATACAVLKDTPEDIYKYLGDVSLTPTELGVSFAHIESTAFAQAMMRMYDYAYRGIIHLGEEDLTYESIHTWTTALLIDAAKGEVANEWDTYGAGLQSTALLLVKVAETANARLILEGAQRGFYYFNQFDKDDVAFEEGYLSVRQVALLSGMEELSIRAAANPNRANQLKPTKTEKGTRFEVSVVKDWLIQKKRYIPITKQWFVNDFDLSKSYRFLDDITYGLNARYNVVGQQEGYQKIDKALKKIGINASASTGLYVNQEILLQEDLITKLAEILSLPSNLLNLRIQEALAATKLRQIEYCIQALGQEGV